MAFSMFSAQISPIAINFGTTSAKLLQIEHGEKPTLIAAAEIRVPEPMRGDHDAILAHVTQELPRVLKDGKFRGKRIVTAVPTSRTVIQHMEIQPISGSDTDTLVKAQLQLQMGCAPESVVVRSIKVDESSRAQPGKTEYICFAVARDVVMRYIDALKKIKLEVTGMHTEAMAMVRAFDHLSRRDSDKDVTTVFVDLGWSGMRTSIAHGRDIRFSRFTAVGGRHLDDVVARSLNCDAMTAHKERLQLFGAGASALSPAAAAALSGSAILKSALNHDSNTAVADEERRGSITPPELQQDIEPATMTDPVQHVRESLDTLAEELALSVRYHRAQFPERPVDRVIFLGGESRQTWMCQHLVQSLDVPAQLGDPLARLKTDPDCNILGVNLKSPQPGWAVACGLCSASDES